MKNAGRKAPERNTRPTKAGLDWGKLGFAYMDTKAYVTSVYKNGRWGALQTRTDAHIDLHVAATCLHYGQACFEGLKAFGRKDGRVGIFRPRENAKRLAASARRLMMQPVPERLFIEACGKAVRLNRRFVPPYGTGASMYIRPLLIGTSPHVGLHASEEYLFAVLAMPVGPYYKDGFFPVRAYVQENYDRAAPRGVGNIKAAGNYAAGLLGDMEGKKKGYPICLYLDSASHRFIDEFGTSNFIGITADNGFVTPDSSSILPSITNKSLQQLARDAGMKVECRRVPARDLSRFVEVGACGTAAVITPVSSVTWRGKVFTFGKPHVAGDVLTGLYRKIQAIQYGDCADRHGWMLILK